MSVASSTVPTLTGSLLPVDPAYEFDCPRYRDFDEADDEQADIWFNENNGKIVEANGERKESNANAVEPVQDVSATISVMKIASPVAVAATAAPVEVASASVLSPAVAVTSSSSTTSPSAITVVGTEEDELIASTFDERASNIYATGGSCSQSFGGSMSLTGTAGAELGAAVRASLLFGCTTKRSSLPALDEQVDEAAASTPQVVQPVRELTPIEQQAAQTDSEVEALHMSLFAEPEAAAAVPAMNAPITETPSSSASAVAGNGVVRSIIDELMAVSDAPAAAVANDAEEQSNATTGRKTARAYLAESKSLPSFLRPTAAFVAKMAVHASGIDASGKSVAAPSTERPQITSRRPMHKIVQQEAAKPVSAMAAAQTPKPISKKRAHNLHLEELARPRTAVKSKKELEEAAAVQGSPVSSKVKPQFFAGGVAKPALTVAQSPALSTRTRVRVNPSIVSSEEAELAKIAVERDETMKMMKHTSRVYQQHEHAHHHHAHEVIAMPVRSVVPLTQTEEFQFETAKRAKMTAALHPLAVQDLNIQPQPQSVSGKDTYRKELVKDNSVPVLTKVQPFSFLTGNRATSRTRAPILSSEEAAVAELAAQPKFKALPLNKDIFTSGGEMGVPRVQKAKLTDPTSPELATKKREMTRKQHEAEQQSVASAVAAPIAAIAPAPISSPVAHVAPKSAKKPVIKREVVPFHLATEERGRSKEEEFERRARDEEMKAVAARAFVARPLSAAVIAGAPAVVPMTHRAAPSVAASVVITASSNAPSCIDHSKDARAKFESRVKAEQERERENMKFRARPNPFATAASSAAISSSSASAAVAADFIPAKSERPLTTPIEPHFASDARASARAEFDSAHAKQEAELTRLLIVQAEEKAKLEAREQRSYRRQLVPRTTPLNTDILSHPTFVVHPSSQPLTMPESPMLITKRREATKKKNQQALAAALEHEQQQEQESEAALVRLEEEEAEKELSAIAAEVAESKAEAQVEAASAPAPVVVASEQPAVAARAEQ